MIINTGLKLMFYSYHRTLDSNEKSIHMSMFCDSLWGSEQLAAVGGQAVDRTVVSPDLAEGRQRVGVPEAQQPSSASAEQHLGAWHHAQSTNPVCLGTDGLLEETTAS